MTDVTFICTGQGGLGTHDSAVPEQIRVHKPWQEGQKRQRGQGVTELRCPVCDRNCRIGYHVMQKLQDSGLPQIDISLLPI